MEGGCSICGSTGIVYRCSPCRLEFCRIHDLIHQNRMIRMHRGKITIKELTAKVLKVSKELLSSKVNIHIEEKLKDIPISNYKEKDIKDNQIIENEGLKI